MKESKNKNRALWLALGILLALAAAVGLYFGVRAIVKRSDEPAQTQPPITTAAPESTGTETSPEGTGTTAATGSNTTETPEMTAAKTKAVYTDESITVDDPRLDQTVATCGDYSMTNRDAQIFYTMQYYNFMNENGYMMAMLGMLDASKPLYEQTSTVGDLTWEQYFLMASCEDFQQFASLTAKASAEGYTMSQADQEQMESAMQNLQTSYATYGYDSLDAFVQGNFGPSVRYEDYERYLKFYYYAMSYENSLYQGITATEQEMNDYYDAHPEEFAGVGKDQPNVNVRHVLITPDVAEGASEEKAAAAREVAKTKAEELLATFEESPSEEAFAQLAAANSEDPGSKDNGGLYEDVYPGQMVQTFNDWCFDPARQPGDTGIVETSYGFHIMYFVSKTDTYYWKSKAEQSIRTEKLYELLDSMLKEHPGTIDYENIVLSPLPKVEAS